MTRERTLIWLDLVRGTSAIAVCAGHLRNATLRNYVELHAPNLFQKFLYIVTGLGHQAVMVFFVMSGFFVGGSILKNGQAFKTTDYAISRLTRLWIVLIPALVMTLVIDKLIVAYAPEVLRGAYAHYWSSGPSSTYSTSALTFLGNTLFVQTVLTPVFGTNGPLWSLANEFWYYVIFPLTAVASGYCITSEKVLIRTLSGVAAALLMLYLPAEIRLGFVIWLMGVLVWLCCTRLQCKRRPLALLCTFSFFSVALAYSRLSTWQAVVGLSADVVVGLGFSTLCVVIALWPPPQESFFGVAVARFARTTSGFSYSLYLSHFPVVMLIATLGYRSTKALPDLEGTLRFLGWLGALVSFGMFFWLLFERHTSVLRETVGRRLIRC